VIVHNQYAASSFVVGYLIPFGEFTNAFFKLSLVGCADL
jgi:hypothetical protein